MSAAMASEMTAECNKSPVGAYTWVGNSIGRGRTYDTSHTQPPGVLVGRADGGGRDHRDPDRLAAACAQWRTRQGEERGVQVEPAPARRDAADLRERD